MKFNVTGQICGRNRHEHERSKHTSIERSHETTQDEKREGVSNLCQLDRRIQCDHDRSDPEHQSDGNAGVHEHDCLNF